MHAVSSIKSIQSTQFEQLTRISQCLFIHTGTHPCLKTTCYQNLKVFFLCSPESEQGKRAKFTKQLQCTEQIMWLWSLAVNKIKVSDLSVIGIKASLWFSLKLPWPRNILAERAQPESQERRRWPHWDWSSSDLSKAVSGLNCSEATAPQILITKMEAALSSCLWLCPGIGQWVKWRLLIGHTT